jgi:hypothetical protein
VVDLLITDEEAAAIWKRVSGYKDNALIRLYKRDVSEFLADRQTLLAEVSRLTLALASSTAEVERLTVALAECEKEPEVPVVVLSDPQQVSADIYFFALDPLHASYAATEATLSTSLSSRISALAAISSPTQSERNELIELRSHGTYANADGGNGYTGLKIVGPCYGLNGLSISASGVCRYIVNYRWCRNLNYAAPTTRTNAYGDSHTVYGSLLKAPERIPTTGYDRLIAWMKGQGTDTVLFTSYAGRGDYDGDNYLNSKPYTEIAGLSDSPASHDPTQYTIMVFCDGPFSRFSNEGNQGGLVAAGGFVIRNGSAGTRTQLLADPTTGAQFMQGAKLGSGSWGEAADWTNEGGGVYSFDTGSASASLNTSDAKFVMSSAGGTLRGLTRTASLALCQSTLDTYYPIGDVIYVHLADGSNPRTTTYIGLTNIGGCKLDAAGKSYFDVYGIEFHQGAFLHGYNQGNYALYACKLTRSGRISHNGAYADVVTAQWHTAAPTYGTAPLYADATTFYGLRPDTAENRKVVGCQFYYFADGFYDSSNGATNEYIANNTIIRDSYFEGTGAIVEGVANGNNDSHTIGTEWGCKNFHILNNRMYGCGWQTINPYVHLVDSNRPTRTLTDGVVTNGTFDTDITGWTDKSAGGSSISWSAGKLRLTSVSNALAKAEQAITINAKFRCISGSAATSSGTTVTLDGSPDLTGLDFAGDDQTQLVLFGNQFTDGNGPWFAISAVDNVAKTVTVDRSPGIVTTGMWRIGRQHVVKFTTTPGVTITVSVGSSTGATDILTACNVTADALGVCAAPFYPTATTFYLQFHRSTTGTYDIDNIQLLTSLQNEPYYTEAQPASTRHDHSGGRTLYHGPHYGLRVEDNLITDPLTHADNPQLNNALGEAIVMQGDTLVYGYNGQCRDVRILRNRIEGRYINAIRCKWKLPSPYDHTQIEIAHNVIRGALGGFESTGNATDENGNTTEISWHFHHNDVYVVDGAPPAPYDTEPAYYIRAINIITSGPARRKQVEDNNTFRSGGGGAWLHQTDPKATIGDWQAAAAGNDVRATTSTVTPI